MINEDNQNQNQNLELLPYKKNVSFKWEKLEFENEKNEDLSNDFTFNLWDNNFELQKNIHISDDLKINYKHSNFKLRIDQINGTIEKRLFGIRYFRPNSLIQTGLIYDLFNVLEDKICEKLNINFLDMIERSGLFRINCKQEIPLDKVIYFKDLIVIFDRVDKVNYRGKIKYCIISNIVVGDVLLQK